MLDNTTKQKINTLRDILVGKVSDPKSQVEQITIALFYKFMEDMDNELINDLGGEAKFFSGEYAKYSWTKLFAPSLGGEDMLNLYREAVEKMEENSNIPSAFRDIFKRAYLPYNDPATLRMFLKVIDDGFHYSHSEMLGDAFEYLLSILGTQGDAGQFRTPRHIIDFVAACVNPQKGDVICDPACGTAGFVIAAYKHILKQNTKTNRGDLLSAGDRKKLAQNLIGLDIDPMMVKLALANMYLHGFNDPHIYEYDSLTSEDKWDETYDVVLANPPFMTPKGGIRPHKRFTTQANKAEVLFVDLIASHLTANGRAGIIVPNGIVATTQTAYKNLRKILIEDSLIAVISLPAGVFQPYSGVKTSILILDKALSKKSDSVLFIKVENDGFDLGAQRREIDKNNLPNALKCINDYKSSLKSGSEFILYTNVVDCLLVKKKIVLTNRDVILSGDRYKENINKSYSDFPLVKIGDVFKTSSGGTPLRSKKEYYENGNIPWLKSGEVAQGNIYKSEEFITEEGMKKSSAKLFPVNSVLVAMYGATAGQVGLLKIEATTNQAVCAIYPHEKIVPKYLYSILNQQTQKFVELSSGGGQPNISQGIIKDFLIPLPSIEIQEQIVNEIEGYQKIIDGAKMVVDNYKPTISLKPDREMVELGEVCKVLGGYAFKSKDFVDEGVQVIKMSNVKQDCLYLSKNPAFIPSVRKKEFEKYIIKKGDVLITMTGTTDKTDYGDVCIVETDDEYLLNQRVGKFHIKSKNILSNYLSLAVSTDNYKNEIFRLSTGARQANISGGALESILIPLPFLEEQKAIVAQIEVEQKLVESNKQLIEIYEQKIKTRIAQVWGEE